MRKHIFNAGPCKLPEQALENTAKAVQELGNTGQSIMEVSHRSKEFQAVMDEAQNLFKELLNIPDNYEVMFMGGGASTQFAMIPFNFLKTKAAYVNTGTWSDKAIKEAKMFGEVEVIASSEDKDYAYYPKFDIPTDVDYVHITSNNTIRGTEIFEDLDSKVPLIADMSSDMMSRKVDVSKYAMIYGGAQKNVGPAGVTFIIIRKDMLEKVVDRTIPTMLKYETHIKKGSMYNTPPVINIFTLKETLTWVKEQGGVEEMERRAKERADMLYAEIDRNPMFKGTVINKESRSRMNITFIFEDKYKDLQDDFIKFAGEGNIVGIKGHRSVGGFRASTYNASSIEDVKAMIACMQEFEKKHA
ncbi:MAG: 3-phosphoserine/phosphohydroxythreonine transaminase [Salinivirgaceae bacterium]